MSGKITEAVVYIRGAQITRTQRFKVKKGVSKVSFDSLPLDMNAQSITASSDGNSSVVGVTCSTVYAKTAGKRIADLTAALETLRGELDMANGMLNVLLEEEDLIRKNTHVADGKVFRSEDVKNTVSFFRERMAELCSERIAAQKNIEKIGDKIWSIESEIGANDLSRQRSKVEIELFSDNDTETELALSYFTHNASWTPYYDVRAADVESPVAISSKAMVYQNTGEDWGNVSLILSTGNPSLSGDVPELMPWYIDFDAPHIADNKYQMFNVRTKALKKSEAMLEETSEMEMLAAVPAVISTESMTSVEYALSAPYTVLSSDNGKSVDIGEHKVKADYVYRSVRKLEKDVFLVADVKEWEHLNLLRGNANIFFEDKYVGSTVIDPRKAAEGLRISLGRDKNVIVTRVRGKDFLSKSGLGSNVKASREWELTAKNLKKQKINVVVEDQIPVSVNKSISVDAVSISGAEHDKETGKLEWKFSLNPAESRSFQMRYAVSYPSSKTVVLE